MRKRHLAGSLSIKPTHLKPEFSRSNSRNTTSPLSSAPTTKARLARANSPFFFTLIRRSPKRMPPQQASHNKAAVAVQVRGKTAPPANKTKASHTEAVKATA